MQVRGAHKPKLDHLIVPLHRCARVASDSRAIELHVRLAGTPCCVCSLNRINMIDSFINQFPAQQSQRLHSKSLVSRDNFPKAALQEYRTPHMPGSPLVTTCPALAT
jgi:hypothetical protein